MPSMKRIEAELQAERDVLRAQLLALETQFSPDRLVGKASAMLGGLGEGAVTTARKNPGPLALTAGGLAWMAVKAATRQSGPRVGYDETRNETVAGLRQPRPPMAGFDARVQAADSAMRAAQTAHSEEGEYSMTDTTEQSRLSNAKQRLYETSEGLRSRIEEGLDGLPDGAKDRIRKAREAAISVQARAEAEASRAAQAARATAHDNPLLVGGLAFAAGAALAMMLPRTQIEDNTVGAHRDRLFDEADRIFKEEKAKLQSAAEDVVAEGQKRVKDALATEGKGDMGKAA